MEKSVCTLTSFISICCVVFLASLLYAVVTVNEKKVIKEENITTLTEHKDSIKITINNLDSIKNAKIIEVSGLDNDSTIKLFYQLISE